MSTILPVPNGGGDLNGLIRNAVRRVVTNQGPDGGRAVSRVTERGFSPAALDLLARVESGGLAVSPGQCGTHSDGSLRWMVGRSRVGGPDRIGVS